MPAENRCIESSLLSSEYGEHKSVKLDPTFQMF